MFQSLQFMGSIAHQLTFDKYRYRLFDSDFETEFIISVTGFETRIESGSGAQVAIEVAKVYENRKLNVDLNIVRYYKWMMSCTGFTIQNIIDDDLKYFPTVSKEFYGKYLKCLCRNLI